MAQHGQAFVNDASLPKDTVRLKPGEQVQDAMLYSAKPKYPLGGTEIVRVIRSDGSFAGWARVGVCGVDYAATGINFR